MKGDESPGPFKFAIKGPPAEPTRTEYHEPFTYYFDEDGHCYAMIHDYFREFMEIPEAPKEAAK